MGAWDKTDLMPGLQATDEILERLLGAAVRLMTRTGTVATLNASRVFPAFQRRGRKPIDPAVEPTEIGHGLGRDSQARQAGYGLSLHGCLVEDLLDVFVLCKSPDLHGQIAAADILPVRDLAREQAAHLLQGERTCAGLWMGNDEDILRADLKSRRRQIGRLA